MKEKLAKKNQSVEKVFQIIEVMAANKGALRLQDISIKLGLPTSTVLRFLNTLVMYNYVYQNPDTLKYSLTLKFAQIGSLISSQLSVRDIAHPYLIELSEKCHESTCLAIEEELMVVYIDVVDGPDNMLKAMQRIGKRAPLHSTGVGKVLLLNYDDKRLEDIISTKGLPALTKNTITTKDALLSELNKINSSGYSIDDEECELGARCIASPIRDYTGKIVASVSISGPVSRMTSEKIDTIKEYIIETSKKISNELAYSEN